MKFSVLAVIVLGLVVLGGCVSGHSYVGYIKGLPEYDGPLTYLDRIPVHGYERVGVLGIVTQYPLYDMQPYIEKEARKHGADTIVLVSESEGRNWIGVAVFRSKSALFYRKTARD